MSNYILDGKTPVLEPDIMKWAQWHSTANRHVRNDFLPNDIHVSTVFLGLDHRFVSEGEPILFETMIFGGEHNEYQERYCTWEEAEAGHQRALELVYSVTPPPVR